MKIFILFLLGTQLAWADSSALMSIFGDDNRFAMDSHAYPYSAIVRIEDGEGSHCTGSLISRDVVLTNSHCVIDESGSKRRGLKVVAHGLPGYSPSVSVKDTVLGTHDYKDEPRNDWSLLRLSQPIGDVIGHFDLAQTTAIADGYTLAGYSGDYHGGRTAGVHTGCSIKGRLSSFGVIMHDCDMTHGASGSAIWRMDGGRAVINALNSAQRGERDHHDEWSVEESNLGLPVENFRAQALSFAAQSSANETGLVVCNTKKEKLKFAFAFWSEAYSQSKGWQKIKAGECEEVKLPRGIGSMAKSYKVYAYADGNELGSNLFHDFCIGGFFSFEKNEGECSSNKEKSFSNIGILVSGKINRIDI